MNGTCNFYSKCIECDGNNPLCASSYHIERVEKCLVYLTHLETPEQAEFRFRDRQLPSVHAGKRQPDVEVLGRQA